MSCDVCVVMCVCIYMLVEGKYIASFLFLLMLKADNVIVNFIITCDAVFYDRFYSNYCTLNSIIGFA